MGDLGKGHHQQVDKPPPLPIDSRGTRVEGEGIMVVRAKG